MARVGDLADQIRGVTFSKNDASTEPKPGLVPVLRAGNIQEAGLSFDDLVYVPAERVSQRQFVREDDVVIAASSGSLDVVGKAARSEADFPGGFGAFLKVLRPNGEVDAKYFAHYFKTREYRRTVSTLAAGANINNLKNEHLNELLIPVPPLDKQRRIASILDHADAIRARRAVGLRLLDEVTWSVFSELLGEDWPTETLASITRAVVDCPHSTPKWTEEGEVCLRTSNLTKGGWNWSDKRFVSPEDYVTRSRRSEIEPGDIVLSREGTVGIAAIVEPGMRLCMGQRLVQVRTKENLLTPDFLLHYLLFALAPERISHVMVGSTAQHLNVGELRELAVPVPPRALQAVFSEQLKVIRVTRNRLLKSSEAEVELVRSLQHRAFAGQL